MTMVHLSIDPILLELEVGSYVVPILLTTLAGLVSRRRKNQWLMGGDTGGSGISSGYGGGGKIRNGSGIRGMGGGTVRIGAGAGTKGIGGGVRMQVRYDAQLTTLLL